MVNPQAHSAAGRFEGFWSDPEASVAVFKGVPYAEAPVGDRRFRPSELKSESNQHYLAQRPSLPAWQSAGNNDFVWSLAPGPCSEDCLYLNIWTPAGFSRSKAEWPVMVWFHGGAHIQSWAHHALFDGEQFARQGVVLVTVNYRLGPWGFLALPMLAAESEHDAAGNYGLQDKITALQWIQRNIAAFGGNAEKVTVFGQSAGAQSICALMASPLAKGLFHQVIGQSGHSLQAFDRDPKGFETGERLMAELGHPKNTKALREISNAQLLAAMEKSRWASYSRISVDGWVLPEAPLASFKQGSAAAMPLLLGSLANEGLGLIAEKRHLEEADFDRFLVRVLGSDRSRIDAVKAAYADVLRQGFPAARHAIESDLMMSFGMRHWAALNADQGADSYLYFMPHTPPVCRIYRPDAPQLVDSQALRSAGAYHSGELAYVFNNQHLAGYGWSQEDRMLAQEMSIYWANFAKTGAPASDTTAPWPAWSATGDTKYLIQPPESSPGLEVKLTALAQGLGISLKPKR